MCVGEATHLAQRSKDGMEDAVKVKIVYTVDDVTVLHVAVACRTKRREAASCAA